MLPVCTGDLRTFVDSVSPTLLNLFAVKNCIPDTSIKSHSLQKVKLLTSVSNVGESLLSASCLVVETVLAKCWRLGLSLEVPRTAR